MKVIMREIGSRTLMARESDIYGFNSASKDSAGEYAVTPYRGGAPRGGGKHTGLRPNHLGGPSGVTGGR